MKSVSLLFLSILVFSCGTKKAIVLENFFEIVSTSDEFRMLQGDEKLKGKITPNDINESNFLILNMGEKSINGCSINVTEVQETEKNIIVTVKEIEPDANGFATLEYVYPYSIIKINSKKEIIFK